MGDDYEGPAGGKVHLLDSVFTRLIAWAIAVCTIVVLLLGLMVTVQFNQLTENSLRRAVEADQAALLEAYRDGGEAELVERINARLAFVGQQTNPPHLLLADGAGKPIVGNLSEWPGLSAQRGESGEIAIDNGATAFARTVRLSSDRQLLVSREARWDRDLRDQLLLAFVAAGLFVVLSVALAGQMTARRLSARVHRIIDALRDPRGGGLEALESGRREKDEIGELGRQAMDVLARLRTLVVAHRETADKIAHEIRTPLMHLDSRLFRALGETRDEDLRAVLGGGRADIRAITAMLDSLLDIAASEASRGDLSGLPTIDLSELVARIGGLYEPSAEESGHTFHIDVTDGVLMRGDKMQLSRMIANLLDNAFKYVPPDGEIRMTLRPGPVLTVADNGPGVAAADRPHIFERFRRGGQASIASSGGSGLGLALVRAIAERHGLDVALMPGGKGATFVVRRATEARGAQPAR